MKINLITLFAACILFAGCSKDKSTKPQNTQPASSIKIQIVSGDAQSDTVGHQLTNPVIFKVTKNGSPASGYTVLYQLSGCNSDLANESTSAADGTAGQLWNLAGDVGQQSMEAIVLDASNKHIDSVTAHATGIAPGKGWHPSACGIQGGLMATSFCKLSTGRLFTCFSSGKAYLRYSDDNGLSWNAVKSLGNSHELEYVFSTANDGLFAFAYNEGPLYSSDAGQTWTTLATTPFATEEIANVSYTASGKIFLISRESGLYISTDNGKTWTSASKTLLNSANDVLFCASEAQNGDLYVVSQGTGRLYKSVDEGAHWTDDTKPTSPPVANEQDEWFYIDPATNYFYKIRSDNAGGVYVSKDNDATYTQLINVGNQFLDEFSIQSDGNMYYDYLFKGVYRASITGANLTRLVPSETSVDLPYILAKNNNFMVVSDSGDSISVYTP
jgi:hypothetical protein